jgi:hypothetical protein
MARLIVDFLLCRFVWQGTHRHRSPVHRTTANTPLANKGRLRRPRYPSPTKFDGFPNGCFATKSLGQGLPRIPIKTI